MIKIVCTTLEEKRMVEKFLNNIHVEVGVMTQFSSSCIAVNTVITADNEFKGLKGKLVEVIQAEEFPACINVVLSDGTVAIVFLKEGQFKTIEEEIASIKIPVKASNESFNASDIRFKAAEFKDELYITLDDEVKGVKVRCCDFPNYNSSKPFYATGNLSDESPFFIYLGIEDILLDVNAEKENLLKRIFSYYDYKYEFLEGGEVKESDLEGGYSFYNTVDEALKDWLDTLERTNKKELSKGLPAVWKDSELDFIKLL